MKMKLQALCAVQREKRWEWWTADGGATVGLVLGLGLCCLCICSWGWGRGEPRDRHNELVCIWTVYVCVCVCVIFSYLCLVLTTACYVAILDIYLQDTFAKHRQTSAQNPTQHTLFSLSSLRYFRFQRSCCNPKWSTLWGALQTSFRLSRLMGLWDCAIGGHFHVPSIYAAPSSIKLYLGTRWLTTIFGDLRNKYMYICFIFNRTLIEAIDTILRMLLTVMIRELILIEIFTYFKFKENYCFRIYI